MPVLVDSNIILDLVKQDPVWLDWSKRALEQYADGGLLANAIVYAELCSAAESPEAVDSLLASMDITVAEIPRKALFDAANAHLAYRRQGGAKTSPLPDFFIGAHAQAMGIPLLTRDQGRYRSYFPHVALICP